MSVSAKNLEAWQRAWPEALSLWNRFTQLMNPRWCCTAAEEQAEGLSQSFAMIRLHDHTVVISLRQTAALELDRFALEILAHEIGHHIYCPADISDQGRLLARIAAALDPKREIAPLVANLYADLLINDRLQRSEKLNLAGLYRALRGEQQSDKLWTFYMRIYEILWQLARGSLAQGTIDKTLDFDASIGARLVRHYAKDWLEGGGRFALLCLRYLLEDEAAQTQRIFGAMHDTARAGAAGGVPSGLTEIERGEENPLHPSLDDELTGLGSLDDQAKEQSTAEAGAGGDERVEQTPRQAPSAQQTASGSQSGQYREPFQYGEILKSMGVEATPQEVAIRYYRERAIPHLIPFPRLKAPDTAEPQAEGLLNWDAGSPVENIDWIESVIASPHVIPGVTTVERAYGIAPGREPEVTPVDLDLYVDSSGSMPCPQVHTSYLTLAGAIVALSALRVGARVQATLWSGTRQFLTTGGFISDEHKVLEVLTGYFGGATAFPIHILRDTFTTRTRAARPVHIMVISDDGVTTMFDKDEKGNLGWDVARTALNRARGGGTLVLNLWNEPHYNADLRRAMQEGWNVERVQSWPDLVGFARRFSKQTYGRA